MNRSKQRDKIFNIVFRAEFNRADEMPEQTNFVLNEIEELSDNDREYISHKAGEIIRLKDDIDAIITGVSDGWNIDRLGKAELAILRLAVYELRYDDDIPAGVAINEAVELAKTYCNEDAAGFINALLGKTQK